MKYLFPAVVLSVTFAASVHAEEVPLTSKHGNDYTPDLRSDATRIKLQKGDFVAVPVPISNPTLGTGLVGGAAYFYPQTEKDKKLQPASVTALAGLYTSNDSYGFGVAQLNYWDEDRWRFAGVAGYADLKLELLAPDETGSGQTLNWVVDGFFSRLQLSRLIKADWYASIGARFVDVAQSIESGLPEPDSDLDTAAKIRTVGIGMGLEYDGRDMPLNTYSGQSFQLTALFNDEAIGSEQTYQGYNAHFRSFHQFSEPFVLAWQVKGCKKGGTTPLWDACRINLRGFSVTDHLGKVSATGQVEARWKFSKRWGAVGFAGVGFVGDSFNGIRDGKPIPSYGVGLRFSVLPAKRINLRLDYGRSIDSDAIHFSVGEAF